MFSKHPSNLIAFILDYRLIMLLLLYSCRICHNNGGHLATFENADIDSAIKKILFFPTSPDWQGGWFLDLVTNPMNMYQSVSTPR